MTSASLSEEIEHTQLRGWATAYQRRLAHLNESDRQRLYSPNELHCAPKKGKGDFIESNPQHWNRDIGR